MSASGNDAGSSGMASTADGGGVNCPAGVVGDCTGGPATYPTHPGYTLYLDEEFTNPLDLDNDPNFTWSDGWNDASQNRFVESQITFSNGNLVVTADTRPNNVVPPSSSFAENRTGIALQPLSSGEFRTKYNNYRYGWYEARYKPPTTPSAAPGNYISSFFVFRTPRDIDWKEIDIEETPPGNGSPGPGAMGTNAYYRNNNGNDDYSPNRAAPNEMVALPGGTNVESDFHVYAFEWQPTFIKWYFDGNLVRTYTPPMTGVNGDMMPNAISPPDEATKIMMNLWIFGVDNAFGGNTFEQNVYPMSAMYDYVRFYKWDMDMDYPCSPTPSCIKASDCINSKNNPDDHVPNNAAGSNANCDNTN